MATKQGRIRNSLEYLALAAAYAVLAYAPLFAAKAFARLAADLWRAFDKRHRLRVIEQSCESLGITREQARILARDNYRHYTLSVLEIARLSRLDAQQAIERIDFAGLDKAMQDLLAAGKGAVFITGHLGNWEWGCSGFGVLRLVDGVIARHLDNPLIDAFINRIRARMGVEVWYKVGAIRKAMATLKRGRCFAAVIDQDGGWNGVMAPFLGKPASTMSLPVELAMRTGSPILVMALLRDGEAMRFKATFGKPHLPDPSAPHKEERDRLLKAVNDDLSDIIRRHPEQWIWILNRWKTEKTAEEAEAQAD